jgi:hypothetical protein
LRRFPSNAGSLQSYYPATTERTVTCLVAVALHRLFMSQCICIECVAALQSRMLHRAERVHRRKGVRWEEFVSSVNRYGITIDTQTLEGGGQLRARYPRFDCRRRRSSLHSVWSAFATQLGPIRWVSRTQFPITKWTGP